MMENNGIQNTSEDFNFFEDSSINGLKGQLAEENELRLENIQISKNDPELENIILPDNDPEIKSILLSEDDKELEDILVEI